ncbi:MAG: helix-turn-helix domain-containing protein [Candidatus Woesearchaeota archaeon]
MDTRILQDIGLTKGEINIYLALLELGPSTAGGILKKAEIHNSVLHFNLNSLMKKGLVAYVRKGKVRVYQPVDPHALVDYIDTKKEEINRLLPELLEKQNFSKEKEEVEIFEGIKGVTAMLYLLIEDAEAKDDFFFFTPSEEHSKKINEFYKRYDIKRKAKKLISKGIAPKSVKHLFKERTYNKMKFVDFPIPQNKGICNNKVAIVIWGDEPRGILITSKIVAEKERMFFRELWEKTASK